MRKLISIVVALVVGVSAGLGSSELWFRVRNPVLPYCEVARNADAYHMKFVRVKAKVSGSGDMYIYESCDPVEALAAWVQFEDRDRPPGGRDVYDLLFSDPTNRKFADAIVEGEFDAKTSLGCYLPKFRIKASKVKLISPVRDYLTH